MDNKIKKIISISSIITIIIFIIIYFICKYRLYLGSNYCLNFDIGKTHGYDSGWFLNNVLYFDKFNVNTHFPLIKNRAYMWYLLWAHYSIIDLRYFISITWLLSGFMVLFMSYKVFKNLVISLFPFAYISLHPIAFYTCDNINIYRNIIFVPSIVMLLSLYIMFYEFLRHNQYIRAIIISIILSLMFIFIYFLTETGIIFMAIQFGLLSLFFIFSVIDCIVGDRKVIYGGKNLSVSYAGKNKCKLVCKFILKKLFIIMLPIFISFLGIICYKFVNYRVFGVDVINMRTEGEIARFISNVQDIESKKTNTLIWCSEEQIDKAYKVSKTFQQNKKIYNHIKTDKIALFEDTNDIQGDFLGWSVTNAINNHINTYQEAIVIFRSINEELEEAFKSGVLKRTEKIKVTKTLGRYSLDEIRDEIIPLFKENFWTLISLKDLNLFVYTTFLPSQDNEGLFFDFFHVDKSKETNNLNDEVTNIIKKYSNINICLFFIMFINIILSMCIGIFQALNKYIIKNESLYIKVFVDYKYLILSIVFFMFYVLYVLSISFFNIWLYRKLNGYAPVHTYYYASMSIGFILFAFILSFMPYYKCLIENFNRLNAYLYGLISSNKMSKGL